MLPSMKWHAAGSNLLALVLCASPVLAFPPTIASTVDIQVEGRGATLFAAKPNVSDVVVPPQPDFAICALPCAARLSTETSYVTLGKDGALSKAFRVTPATERLTVQQGSGAMRTASLFGLGTGAVLLGAGLGFFVTHAVANADNNPSSAETAGAMAVPLFIGGAVSLTLGAILYALSGTSIRDQRGQSLALHARKMLAPSFSFTD